MRTTKGKRLKLEINSKAINDTSRSLKGTGVMITPPIDEDFWIFRVKLSKKQAIVGFPKFSVIGIGFQKEEDWNTNLPSGQSAVKILDHIEHNKGDDSISRGDCLEAILLIQEAVQRLMIEEHVELMKKATDDIQRLAIAGQILRKAGYWEVAQAGGH